MKALKEVQAVLFWRYGKAAFAATYGRIPGSTKYSKDFLQSPAAQFPIFDRVLERTGAGTVPIKHVWPGGESQGEWRKSAADERRQLSWLPMNAVPKPWRVGNPNDAAITIPGTPGIGSEAGADSEFAALEARDLDPWIVSVKLKGDTNVLHARAYLGKPLPGMDGRSLATLPQRIRDAMAELPSGTAGGAVQLDTLPPITSSRAPGLVGQIVESLERDPNVLLIGPPGTGKTVALEDLQSGFENQPRRIFFDPDRWDYAWQEEERLAISLVFHPSYGYEDFVAGLLPSMEKQSFRLTARPGPLLNLSHWARGAPQRRALLIIDEFNRGPTAAIFGDALALLDADRRVRPSGEGTKILRPYPREDMDVDVSYADAEGATSVSAQFGLPDSLWLVAALNSSDRSVTPLDAALRRRFAMISVAPDYQILAEHFGVAAPTEEEDFQPSDPLVENWSPDEVKRLLLFMLRSLNDRISLVIGADFLLGHALLWPVSGDTVERISIAAAHAFDERIAATLRLTFVDQDESLAAILQAGGYQQGAAEGPSSAVASWHLPSPEMQAVAPPRLQLIRLANRPYREIVEAFRKLL